MPFSIRFINKQGRSLIFDVLDRSEYSKLSDDAKIEYNCSPILGVDDEEAEATLGVQGFIYGIIEANDSGGHGLPEILDEFMKKSYPIIFKGWLSEFQLNPDEISWSDRYDYFWSFLDDHEGEVDEDGFDPVDKADIFFLDYAYKNDFIYALIIDECQKLSIPEDIVPSYELRQQAVAGMMNVLKANSDLVNPETKFATAHIAMCIDLGGWGNDIILRCADHSDEPVWDNNCQLAVDFVLSIKAWMNANISTSEELMVDHKELIFKFWNAYEGDLESILESINWIFIGRLYMGAFFKMYPDHKVT